MVRQWFDNGSTTDRVCTISSLRVSYDKFRGASCELAQQNAPSLTLLLDEFGCRAADSE